MIDEVSARRALRQVIEEIEQEGIVYVDPDSQAFAYYKGKVEGIEKALHILELYSD